VNYFQRQRLLLYLKTSAITALALAPAWGQPDPAACRFAVKVVDRGGESVRNARVSLVATGSSHATDDQGWVCFAESVAQPDQLVVTAEGFSVAALEVAAQVQTGPMTLEVELLPAFDDVIVVSANRLAKRLLEVPVHIQQINRSAIEASAARTLAEAIEYTSGLRVESNCQNCNTSQLRLLGLEGPYTQIVVDGQPSVSSLAMVYGLEQIPARLLDGIEVVKGSGSAIYGASAVAGTVNLLPHQADHTHIEIDSQFARFSGEDGRSLNALADWGSETHDRSVTFYGQIDEVPAVDVDGDRYSEVTQRQLAAGGARFDLFLLDNRARLSGDLNLTSADRRGGDLERFHLRPDETTLTEQISTRRTASSLRFLHTASSRFDYRLALSWAETDRESYYGAGFDPNAYGTTENPNWVGDAQFNHYFDNSTLTWGTQYTRDEIDDVQLGYDRVLRESYTDYALFAQDDRKLGSRLTVLWGARVDDHSAVDKPIVSPRGAVLWSPKNNLTLRASAGRGFRPPATFDEDLHIELIGGGRARVIRNGPGLREESSTSFLLSTEWRPTFARRGSAAFEVALFSTRLNDLFFNQEADDPTTEPFELLKVNLGGATVEGIELSGSVRWGSTLSLDAGFVVQTARFDEPEPDFGSRNFFRTPEQYGNLGLRIELPQESTLFIGGIYTGRMDAPHFAGFIAERRLERTPEFLTFDVNVSHEFDLGDEKAITLTIGGRNITDQYQADLDRGPNRDPVYVYGPRFPRSWFAQLGVRF
jgi:outer membrane receptor for ferrienterochelin and colicins